MSQNKFVSLPVLLLRPSKTLLALVVVLHLVALFTVSVFVYLHISVNVILGLLICFSFYYYLQYYSSISKLKFIKHRLDGMWVLDFDGKPSLASLEPKYFLTEWLIVLRFKIVNTKIKSVPIFTDSMSAENFKQLRVVLPFMHKVPIK